jgi:hypothetical protein
VVTLYNAFSNSPVATVPTTTATTPNGGGVIVTGGTGACLVSGGSANQYWDIGVRGDSWVAGDAGPNHRSGVTLNPRWSVLSPNAAGYNNNNMLADPQVQSQYCNGSRQPPEACGTTAGGATGGCGWAVPPGIADATVPNPVFNLTPVATVDEGNNWINLRWGPLALTNPTAVGPNGNYGAGPQLGNYGLASGSPAIDYVPVSSGNPPNTDFFGNPRPDPGNPNSFDVGAIEFQSTGVVGASLAPSFYNFGLAARGIGIGGPLQFFMLTNTGNVTLTGIGQGSLGGANAASFTIIRFLSTCGPAGNGQMFGQTSLQPGTSCLVTVQFRPRLNQPTGVKNATVSVTDAAGTQTSTITGTAR